MKSRALTLLTKAKDNTLDKCRHCKYLLICQNGCVYKNITREGEPYFDQEYCDYMRGLIEGVIAIINKNCEEKTLVNEELIEFLNKMENGDLIK